MARSRDLGKLPFELKGGTVKTILSKGSNDDYDFVFRNLEAADMPKGIDSLNISTGVVSNTEFNYLDGVTSNIQGQIDAIKGIKHATASGTDTYTATITGVTSYADGDAYLIRFTIGNTTGCTLNINSLGAKTLYRNNDGALIGGDIVDGGEMLCVYNSTLNGFQAIGTAPNTLLAYVTNGEASTTITKGQPVYAAGGVGDRMKVKLAYNTGDATSAQTVGLVLSSSIAAGQKGLIIMQGLLDNLNILPTSTFADGDPIYLGATAGSITNVKPYAPNHLVYLGVVTTASNGNAGRMYVRVQNGYELDELHNVQAQTPSTNDVLYYFGGNQWKTASISSVLGYTPQSALSGTGIVKSTSGTISYLTDNSANWDTAYTNRITSLTTTGSSGSATLVSNTLNIPTYTLTGLGGQPLATNLTSLSGLTYASASFVKMTAAGTFSLDTATYLTGNQTITLSGDVSGSGTTAITTSIGANKVTNAMLVQAAANSILGNKTGSAANVAYLTSTEVTAMLDTFTSTLKGLTPASGGGTTKFLRADGNWAAPYTFSTGLTESSGVVTDNLSTGVAGGQSVIGGTAASNNLTLSSTSNATKGKILFGTSAYDEANNRLGIGTASPSYGVHFVLPTLNTGETAFYLSSAISAASTGVRTMIQFDLTTAGSNVSNIYGFNVNLLAGYTGQSPTQCARFINSATGTATNVYSGAVNAAAAATANGVTNGANFGLGGTATNALINIGNRSIGTGGSTAASTNIGMCGFGNNGTSTGTCFQIGGFFGLHTATPTFGASAALMCDNDTQAVDIFVARDNGTKVWSIADGGNATWGDGINMVFGGTTGTKIGTATSQKIGFWNAAPIIQPTTGVASATRVAGATTALVTDTYDGYTVAQVVKALRNLGILA